VAEHKRRTCIFIQFSIEAACRRASEHTPAAEDGVSFDDLVGACKNRLRDCQAERVGGVQIDDQLEFGRLLDRQIGGFGAVEDLSGVDADLAIDSGEAGSIADQAAGRGELALFIDRRKGMA
jgi:hypothetical protein